MNTAVKTLMITGLLTIAAAASAWACRIEDRQARQMHRINRGVSSGQLIKYETNKLMREQRVIKRKIQIARADGMLTHIEIRRLTYLQDRASRNIRRFMHNNLFYRSNRFERGLAPAATQRRKT
jgi:hypothetical protein